MCNWRRWVLPGLLATGILTALAMIFHAGSIEEDLTGKATADLAADHPWATAELDGRDLTLTGTAPTETAQTEAANLAANAYDVRVVRNETDLIALVEPYTFSASKNAEGVVLNGFVPNEDVRTSIVGAAETALPGLTITDELELARGMPDGFTELAEFGLSQLGSLTTGEASLRNLDYAISGVAVDSESYEAELGRANGELPAGGTLASAEITPPSADPYIWNAEKSITGAITLNGFAPSFEARLQIEAAATEANPGAPVTNNIQIAAGAPEGFTELSLFGLNQLNDLSAGSANLSNLDYSVEGVAIDSAAFDQATAAANGDLPGDGVLASADISPPTIDPYTWSATKSVAGDITLDGFSPSAEVRATIEAAAQEANPEAEITNNLRIAAGAPDTFSEAATFGVGQLGDFASGSVQLSNLDYSVTGSASDSASFDRATAAVEEALPGGMSVTNATISPPNAQGAYTWSATKSADGAILLEGLVPSAEERAALEAATTEANPGAEITNNLQIAAGAPDGFSQLATFGIEQLADFSSGSVTLSNLDYSVNGIATDSEAFERATDFVENELPDDANLASATITPPTISPYTFTATKAEDGAVTLDGFIASIEARDITEAVAAQSTSNSTITNNLQIAAGEPDGFKQAVAFGLEQLGDFTSGSASLSDLEYTVEGVAADSASFDKATAAVAGTIPGGATLAGANITPPSADGAYNWSANKDAEGNIVLSGLMPTAEARTEIADRAAEINPGAAIDNQMEIAAGAPEGFIQAAEYSLGFLPTVSTGSASISGDALAVRGIVIDGDQLDAAEAIEAQASDGINLTSEIDLPPAPETYRLIATKTDDILELGGYAPRNASKAAILEAANSIDGVTVIEEIELRSGVPEGVVWNEAAAFAINSISGASNGTASIVGDVASIDAEASDVASFDSLTETWNAALGAGLETGNVDIRLPQAAPYTWRAEKNADGVTLSGNVPSNTIRSEIAEEASEIFGASVPVDNRLTLASGQPEGFEAAAALSLNSLNELEDGFARITDTDLIVSGTAPSEAMKAQLDSSITGDVPSGFTGTSRVTFTPEPVAPAPAPEPVAPEPEPEPQQPAQLTADQCQTRFKEVLIEDRIQFETNEAIINAVSFSLLDRVAAIAKECPAVTVRVEGHTDSRGSRSLNQGLSDSRANAVRDYLVNAGVSADRLQAQGFGEANPIASNQTPEGRAQNRRIELTVVE